MNTKHKNLDDPEKINRIKDWISTGEVDTITIDTTVFDDEGMRLDKGQFALLKQFGRHPATLVISEIVLKEIKKHLTVHLTKVKTRVSRDMTDALELIGGKHQDFSEIKHKIEQLPDAATLCEQQTQFFLTEAKAEIIEATPYVKMSELIDLYFNQKPPFHNDNPKKSEFPDAIALASLEAWAIDNDKRVVVVSRDADWKSFCEQSRHLQTVSDLATALELFQTPDEIVQDMMKRLKKELVSEHSFFKMMILNTLSKYDWYGDSHIMAASHHFHFDEEDVELVKILSFDLAGDDGLKLTGVGDENISVTCEFDASAIFAVEFLFQNWNKENNEYVKAGRARLETDAEFKVSVLLTTPIKHGGIEYFETEVKVEQLALGFGIIEPNWLSDRE